MSALTQVVPGRASSPPASTVHIGEAGSPTAMWTGGPLTGNPDPLGPPAPTCVPGQCDRELVTISAPAGYTTGNVISLTASVSTDPTSTGPGTSTWDIAIVDSGGNTVAASGAGTNPNSTTASDVQPGTYTVEVDGDIATADTYVGTATVSSSVRVAQQSHPTGGLSFGREVVADPFRLGTEPTVQTAPDGTIYEGPIFGFSTTQSFINRSDDLGRTFNTLGVPGVGKVTNCGGGGDEDLATDKFAGDLFFLDLGGEPSVPAAVTNDHGNTTPFGVVPTTGAEDCTANDQNGVQYFPDRQWLSTDYVNGLEWYIYRDGLLSVGTPTDQFSGHPIYGEYIKHAPLPTAAGTAGVANITQTSLCHDNLNADSACVTDVAVAGNAVTDNYGPAKGYTYIAETTKNGIGLIRVNPTGFTEQVASPGASAVLFPTVAVDNGGNVYETYVDAATYQVMFTYSKSQGTTGTWTTPVAINGAPAAVTVMPWVVAGDAGRVDVVFYGSPSSQPPTTNSGPWNAYMMQSLSADTSTPNWAQQAMTDRPNHVEPVCLSGLGCTTNTGPGGDRELGDFFRVALDPSGRAVVSFADGNNKLGQENGGGNQATAAPSFADFVQQAGGPSLYGTGNVSPIPVDTNSVTVAPRSNHIPFSSPTGQGPSNTALELLSSGTSVATDSSNNTNVNVTITVNNSDPTTAILPPGLPTATYLTRWWFNGQIYYGAAEYTASGWRFFSGQVEPVSDGLAIKYAYYPASGTATGTVTPGTSGSPATISLSIPASQVGSPTPADTLYSVTSYALTHTVPTAPMPPTGSSNYTDFPQIADSLPAYNVVEAATSVPEAKGAGLLLGVGILGVAVAVLPWRRRRRRMA